MRMLCLFLAALGMLVQSAAGKAATITTDVSFTATPIVGFMGLTPPVDPVIGSFHITFDPALSYFDSTSISVNSLNINVDGGVVFSYNPTLQSLNIGGSNLGSGAYFWATNDFSLGLRNDGSGFVLDGFSYSQAGVLDSFSYSPNVVPIPGTLPLLATALVGLVWTRRVRTRTHGAPA